MLSTADLNATDAVTAAPKVFDTDRSSSADFLGLLLQADEDVYGKSSMSPSLPAWNANIDWDLEISRIPNCQQTSALDDSSPLSLDEVLTSPTNASRRRKSPTDATSAEHSRSLKRRKTRAAKSLLATTGSFRRMDSKTNQESVKREKSLERNRLAASKCRQKMKQNTMMLESQYKEQSNKNGKLVTEIFQMFSETIFLKDEVLKHAQCDDEPIKLHLSHMANDITSNGTPDTWFNFLLQGSNSSIDSPQLKYPATRSI